MFMRLSGIITVSVLLCCTPSRLWAQCSLTDATSCVCAQPGSSECELLPDLTISWYGLEVYSGGPSEYSQTATTNAGRLRVSGSTPNIGHGPLEVRTTDTNAQRRFVCGTDTFTVSGGQTNFNCPNGQVPKQIIFQQVYRKTGPLMQRSERMAGSMTYHSAHSHYHVNDWTTMSLRLEDPSEPDPRKWPSVATGAKIGFCLMDYGTCTYYNGHCRSSQEYGQGDVLTTNMFPNQGLYGAYGCGTNIQGISVGRTDIYSKSLDMMWINLMPDLCNGSYWIVAEVDPTNVFQEENDDNNWTAIPFAITQQRPAGSGGTAGIIAPQGLRALQGGEVTLTATPGNAYLWSNGATSRSITVSSPGDYSVTVTAPCGSLASQPVTVEMLEPLPPPVGSGAAGVGPISVELEATGTGGEIVWYDAPVDGQELGVGSAFTTPVLEAPTSFFAAQRSISPGAQAYGGKVDRSAGALSYFNGKQWLFFDAYEPFELASVKVYANGNGDRHFVLVDNVGNLIEERYVYVAHGEQRVDLDFQVPAGTGHRITAFDDNTEIVQQLHRDNTGVSYPYDLAGLGSITGSSGGSSFYYFLYDWEVRTPDVVNESVRTAVLADISEGVLVDMRVKLQGPYNDVDGLMADQLRTQGLVPLAEPFTSLGFSHQGGGGGEVIDAAVLQVAGPDAVVDWVLLELRSATAPAQLVATRSALVTRSGQVVSASGAMPRFPVTSGTYHVAVRHRNHLGCMTASPVELGASAVLVDFTSAAQSTWGTNARKAIGDGFVLWSGNVVADQSVKYTGAANDRDPILNAIGGMVPTASMTGYLSEDVNIDGQVLYTGGSNDRDPILSNIGGSVPTLVLQEQLP